MPQEIVTETCPASTCNLSAQEVEGFVEELAAYHALFEVAFRRPEQHQWSGVYRRGLLSEVGRKTAERMALALGENVRDLQHFIGQSQWQTEAVVGIHQRLIGESLGEADGVVLIDESGGVKQGEESVGVAAQYCGSVGKVANAQVGVYLGYASRRGYSVVTGRLFMPAEWFDAEHARKRAACGVPADLPFKTKPTIGLELLQETVQRGGLPFQ